jgi:hypothetical protein
MALPAAIEADRRVTKKLPKVIEGCIVKYFEELMRKRRYLSRKELG